MGWKAVLLFTSCSCGKNRALAAEGKTAGSIGKTERTAGIDISQLLFESQNSPSIKCLVCDFAGQEIYYFSHTMDELHEALPVRAYV